MGSTKVLRMALPAAVLPSRGNSQNSKSGDPCDPRFYITGIERMECHGATKRKTDSRHRCRAIDLAQP